MIAGIDRIRRNSLRPRATQASVELQQRAQRMLTCEIGFIPNPCFREYDADQAWRRELKKGVAESGPDLFDLPVGGRIRMPAHLERLCAAPLLSPDQEREMFCRMNYLKYRANSLRVTLNAGRPNERTLNQIDHMLSQATKVRNQIVHANIRLVVSIVKKFADERNSFDDLLSEGISCLIKAVDKFDFARGFRFSTYATRAVRREVFRLVQRKYRDRIRFATGSSDELSQQLTTESSPERSELSWDQIDQSIGQLMSSLDQREQFIVQARYGFEDIGEKPTFQRLGEMLGVSKERVRQLEQRALGKLRELAEELRLEPSV